MTALVVLLVMVYVVLGYWFFLKKSPTNNSVSPPSHPVMDANIMGASLFKLEDSIPGIAVSTALEGHASAVKIEIPHDNNLIANPEDESERIDKNRGPESDSNLKELFDLPYSEYDDVADFQDDAKQPVANLITEDIAIDKDENGVKISDLIEQHFANLTSPVRAKGIADSEAYQDFDIKTYLPGKIKK